VAREGEERPGADRSQHQWLSAAVAVVYVVYAEFPGRVRNLCVARSDLEAWQPATQKPLPKITCADAHFELPTNQLEAHAAS
jgi:hypothetical protein